MLTCFLRTMILYLVIIIAMRVMGKRQIGQLQPSELVVAILISEVAAVPMQDLGVPLIYGVIPIITLLAAELLWSALCARSVRMRNLLCGRPSVLIREGVPDQRQLYQMRINAAELMEELRLKDVFDIGTVTCAVLETNGRLSVLVKPGDRPVTVAKAGLPTAEDVSRVTLLIVQGRLIEKNLREENRDRKWLDALLMEKGLRSPSDVFLMTIDDLGRVVIFPAEKPLREKREEAV
ncbi:MAG: DUF421 domain-containing protein [Clostridiaceae bacterium]|nr:DUF421 domain-containing protein [Clostridiaceae bacterium]